MTPRRFAPAVFLAIAVAALTIATTSCGAAPPPPVAVAAPSPGPARVTMPPVVVEGRPAIATDLFALEAVPTGPDQDGVDFFALGEKLVDDGRPGEAVDAYKKALARDPSATTWTRLGRAYLQGVDRARGLACLQEALRRDPARNDVRVVLARAHLDAGDAALARAAAEEALALDPTNVAAHAAVGRAYLGLAMWKEAMRAYQVVVQDDPTSAHARNNLGYAALQIGEDEVALRALEEIPLLRPQKPYMFNNLGVAYERLGRTSDALAAFSRAAELSPSYVKAVANKERLLRTLAVDEQLLAAEALLALRTGKMVAPQALVGEPVELRDVEGAVVDGGVEAGEPLDHVVIEAGGGGSLAGAAVLAPSTEPSLP